MLLTEKRKEETTEMFPYERVIPQYTVVGHQRLGIVLSALLPVPPVTPVTQAVLCIGAYVTGEESKV